MIEWLSDEALDAIAKTFADESDVEKLLVQSREANRLRSGLQHLECMYANIPDVIDSIRELLEGGA